LREAFDWVHVVQNIFKRPIRVKKLLKIWVAYKAVKFLENAAMSTLLLNSEISLDLQI
jgi:hypothetical protein